MATSPFDTTRLATLAAQNVKNKAMAPKMDTGFSMSAPSTFKGDTGFKAPSPSFKGDPGFSGSPQIVPIATALKNFQSMKKVPGPTTPAVQPQPYQSRTEQTLGTLSGLANADPYKFTAAQPFQYNPDADPAFMAFAAQAKRNLADTQANTNAHLRATGQGKSSYSETVAAQQGARAAQDIEDQMIQTYLPQAFAQYQDSADRDMQRQQLDYGATRDKVGDLSSLYGLQDKQDFENPLAESQVTGNYLSGENQRAIQTLLGLKQQAETPGITKEERSGLSLQADQIRAFLKANGVNPELFGANVTAEQAGQNKGQAGIRTMAGAAQDYGQMADTRDYNRNVTESDRGYNRNVLESDRTYNRGVLESDRNFNSAEDQRDIENKLAQDQFDENVKEFGLDYALQQQAADRAAANTAGDNSRSDSAASWNQKMDIWQASDSAPEGIPGVEPGTPWGGKGSDKPDEPDVNDVYAEVYTNLDTMTPDQRKNFLSGEKAGLIKQFGPSGYKQLYGNYFDEDGNPL